MKKRILVVEDQADIRKLIRTTLEFEYYEIYEASDAAEALEAVKRLHPQLLLLDIMMPGGMNGLELCRLIKSDPSLGSPQVVMLSALSSMANTKRLMLISTNPCRSALHNPGGLSRWLLC